MSDVQLYTYKKIDNPVQAIKNSSKVAISLWNIIDSRKNEEIYVCIYEPNIHSHYQVSWTIYYSAVTQ